jgi:hypothetical protein
MVMGQPYAGMAQPMSFGGSPQPQAYQMPLMVPQQQGQTAPTTTATGPAATGQQSKDPFADLAGLF